MKNIIGSTCLKLWIMDLADMRGLQDVGQTFFLKLQVLKHTFLFSFSGKYALVDSKSIIGKGKPQN